MIINVEALGANIHESDLKYKLLDNGLLGNKLQTNKELWDLTNLPMSSTFNLLHLVLSHVDPPRDPPLDGMKHTQMITSSTGPRQVILFGITSNNDH